MAAVSIGAFIFLTMAEGTRFSKLDDAIKSLNHFRKETENQIRDLNNTVTRFMHAFDQRLEERNVATMRLEVSSRNTTNNFPLRSMKIEVPHFDGTDVSSWIFKIEQFFQFYNTPNDQRIMISSFHLEGPCQRRKAKEGKL